MHIKALKTRGFTLIELLIVIAIIGILATAFLPSLLNAPKKSRDAARIENLTKIADYLTLYDVENGLASPGYSYFRSDYNYHGYGNNDDIQGMILNNIEYFEGVFPEDPSKDNCFIDSVPCPEWHQGTFLYYKKDDLSSLDGYSFLLATRVEDTANGNNSSYYDPSTLSSDGGDYYTIFGQK